MCKFREASIQGFPFFINFRMSMNFLFKVIFLFLTSSACLQSQDTTRVLFVGNSYTYFWNLPQVVEAMAISQKVPLRTAQSTAGGVNLGQHWRGERGLETHQKIDVGQWDFVVLQDHSLRTIQARDSLNHFITKWKIEIEKSNASPLLYLTWAREFNPLMQDLITDGYESIGRQLDVPIAPVGEVWELARQLRPDIDLYDADGSHPSALGTYLAALTFYKSLTGKSLTDIPPRLTSRDHTGEKLYLMIVPPNDAAFCIDVVERVMADYKYRLQPK